MNKTEIIGELLNHGALPERMGICEDFWPETIQYAWPEQGFGKETDPTEHYDLDIVAVTATTFRLSATPTGLQTGDSCGAFLIEHTGSRGAGSADCWP